MDPLAGGRPGGGFGPPAAGAGGGEFWRLGATLILAFLAAPLLGGVAGRVAGLGGPSLRVAGFTLVQAVLAVGGYLGWRRLGRPGSAPARDAGGLWGPLARGAARGPVLVAVQLVATSAVGALARTVGLGEWAARVGQQEERALLQLVAGAGPGWALVLVGLLVAGAPVAEELFFRGYLYGLLRIRSALGPLGAAALSAVAFAALHGYVVHFPALWLSGLLLARWYESSGRLAVPMGAHVAFNTITLAVAALEHLPVDS